jgi:hypothetical protein
MPAGAVANPPWATDTWEDTAWEANTWAAVVVELAFVLDINTRMHVYLCDLYSLPATTDLTTMVARYLASESGEYTARIHKLIRDATDAMT